MGQSDNRRDGTDNEVKLKTEKLSVQAVVESSIKNTKNAIIDKRTLSS